MLASAQSWIATLGTGLDLVAFVILAVEFSHAFNRAKLDLRDEQRQWWEENQVARHGRVIFPRIPLARDEVEYLASSEHSDVLAELAARRATQDPRWRSLWLRRRYFYTAFVLALTGFLLQGIGSVPTDVFASVFGEPISSLLKDGLFSPLGLTAVRCNPMASATPYLAPVGVVFLTVGLVYAVGMGERSFSRVQLAKQRGRIARLLSDAIRAGDRRLVDHAEFSAAAYELLKTELKERDEVSLWLSLVGSAMIAASAVPWCSVP